MSIPILQEQPSFGSAFSQQFGEGIGAGLQQSLEKFHQNKASAKAGNALAQAVGKPELGPLLSALGPDYAKIALDTIGAESLASNLGKIYQPTSTPPQQTPPMDERGMTPRTQTSGETDINEILKNAPAKERPQLLRAHQEKLKFEEEKRKTGLKDSQKIRQEYATEAKASQKALESKQRMLKLIEKGDLSNPLLAGIANFLPKGFRESLLSDDSLAYESALFDEFGVLKGMFPGQIRTAEITLLEPKLASLFKNDEAKKQILEQGMESARVALIKGKKAAEVEREMPWLTANSFEEEVNRRSQPDIDKLGSEILGNLQAIADKYSDIVNVYDAQGNVVGTVDRNQANSLPQGFTTR